MRNLSIIIPHFQKQKALRETWKDLMLQIHPEDQIIIVDDHSPDGVPELNCPCTELIRPKKLDEHIYRLCTLRNYGLKHAKYDACIILDPDCTPNINFIDNARKLYDPSVLYGGRIDKTSEDGDIQVDERNNEWDASYWCDDRERGAGRIWGGVMMFSRRRTNLIGWFDEAFNNAWGAEEHDFATRCYHSGLRLRYSVELKVTHQWHPKNTEGQEKNRDLWLVNRQIYAERLGERTPYKPEVGVLVIVKEHPHLLDQCMRSIFRNNIPVKALLINNGNPYDSMRVPCGQWGNRWCVDYLRHHPSKPKGVLWDDAMNWGRENGLKYMIFLNDRLAVKHNGIKNLFQVAEKHPEYVAIGGSLKHVNEKRDRMVGGVKKENEFVTHKTESGVFPVDWVGEEFTIHQTQPLIPYGHEDDANFNDYSWSHDAKSYGHELAVTGDAEAYNRVNV